MNHRRARSRRTCSTAASSSPSSRSKGIKLRASSIRRSSTCYWNMQDPIVGGFDEGEDRAAPRDGDGVQHRRRDQGHPQGPGGRGSSTRSRPASSATTRTTSSGVKYDPARRQCAARPVRLQEGRRRLAQPAGRQAARDPLLRRVPIRAAASWTSCGRSRSTRSASAWKCSKDKFPELLKLEKAVPADDAHRVVDRRLSGRRQLHAAPVRPEHRPEQQRAAPRSPNTTSSTRSRCGCPTARSATSSTTR